MSEETNDNAGLIILGIDARDFMKLKACKMDFRRKGIQFICGQNGAGKSAVMYALEACLLGMTHNPDMPIREGADNGAVEIILEKNENGRTSNIHVAAEWTDPKDRKARRLKVTDEKGPIKKPQTVLEEMFCDVKFDLAELLDGRSPEDARKRRDALMKTVPGLDEALEKLADKRAGIYTQRTNVGRDVTNLTEKLRGVKKPDPELPTEERKLAELTAELQRLSDLLTEQKNVRLNIERERDTINIIRGNIAELEKALEKRKADLTAAEIRHANMTATLGGFPDNLNSKIEELRQEITSVEETNQEIRLGKVYHEYEAELSEATKKQERFTEQIAGLDKRKNELLNEAAFPISSLSVSDEDITFKGKPWSVAATSERLKALLAIGIAQHPQLRALFVRDGNRFDKNSLKLIDQIAVEHGFQVILEYIVMSKDEADEWGGFYIEDGSLIVNPFESIRQR